MTAIALFLLFIPFFLTLVGDCTTGWILPECDSVVGSLGSAAEGILIHVAVAAAILVAAQTYAGVDPFWKRSAMAGLWRIVAITVANLVFGIAVIMGLVLLIVPGVFLAVSFAVYLEGLIIEGTGPIESLGRSWRLVGGERWRLFGVGLSLVIIVVVSVGLVEGLVYLGLVWVAGMDAGLADLLASHVGWLLYVPAVAAVGTVVYLDLRVRKEGLTTAALAAELSRYD